MPAIELKPLPPEAAIRFFESKGYKTGFDWRDVWREEHAHAFTVAKAMRADVLADIREAVDDALRSGRTLAQFSEGLTPLLQKKGWWGRQLVIDPKTGEEVSALLGSPHRLRTIFDTNLRSSYAAGRWERIQRQKDAMPWLRYSAVQDVRTRPHHAAWHGTLLPVDHAWWNTHYPPNGWYCRCRAIQISDRQVKRRGLRPTKSPPAGTRKWLNRRTGAVSEIPLGIDPGFDWNVGRGRGWKGAPAPPPDPNAIPELDAKAAMERLVAPASGSNPGGLYRGADGVERYVKQYDDPAQAYSEAAANRIYRELGFEAPVSSLVREGEKTLHSERLHREHRNPRQEQADESAREQGA